ncbi:MAG: DUF1292 domain-containing protein [Blautia sp.]|jgi:uncharacterized protein YrzB (UPF0473 family)
MSEEKKTAGCAPSDCASCASNCSSNPNKDHSVITLTMEDDTEVDCAILTIFPVGDKEYIALLPLDENGKNNNGEVFLYAFTEQDGNPLLANIEDDDEYAAAADAFDTILENAQKEEEAGLPLE